MAAQGYQETHGDSVAHLSVDLMRTALAELVQMHIWDAKARVKDTRAWKSLLVGPNESAASDNESVQEVDDPRPPKLPIPVVDLELEIAQKEAAALMDGPVPTDFREAILLTSTLEALGVARDARWRGSEAVQEARMMMCETFGLPYIKP